jgi:hypothetical protein
MAKEWSKLSHCKRKQVGSLIVKDKIGLRPGAAEDGGIYVSPFLDALNS